MWPIGMLTICITQSYQGSSWVDDVMMNWDESISQIGASQGSPTLRSGRRWLWYSRPPVIVTGYSGAGKTELWRRLTLKPAEDKVSAGPDEGYYFRKKKRSTLSLITIPGQLSNTRTSLLSTKYMERSAPVNGVIFIACFGYNFIWPGLQADAVASNLNPFSLQSLTKRNKDRELNTFAETTKFITEKWSGSPEANRPKWLLVLCNKVDLYWDETVAAYNHYRLGSGDFGLSASALVENLPGVFRYHVLPIAIQPRHYRFNSISGTLERKSTLSDAQGDASLNLLVDTLEELCESQ